MVKRKPETLALSISLIGTLLVLLLFLADLILARHRDLESGERRLQHFGLMMAEHTARTFEAVDVLLRETATDLSHSRREWESWDPSKGWEYIAQRHSRAMPQLRDLIIFDRLGNQRFISTYFPAPKINVRDRPYFRALEGGAEAATFGPYVGRNSGRYTYAIARRINHNGSGFGGAVFAAIEPDYLQDFCWSNRLSDDFEAVLTNGKGEIVASCRPSDLSRQSPIIGAAAASALFNGRLQGKIPTTGLAIGNGLLVSVSPVPGFSDLRILTAIPEDTLLANWRGRMFKLGTHGLLVTLVLLVGAWLIRRQVRDMAAMTRFLAAASHDLRQPLHALSLFATDLQRQVREGNTRELPRLAEQSSASTTVLGELLDSLLDISRLDVAGIKPDIRPSALQPMLDRLSASFRRAATDRKIRLRFRPTKLWVETDPVMLERIIANLVSNALRYTASGGAVLIASRKRGKDVAVEIRDNGIGIAAEHQAAIFAEFYQVGNTAREQNKGLGLGLSIVDRLAKAVGIAVTLRSQLGEGTSFSLRVTACRPVAQNAATGPESLPAGRVHCIGTSEDLLACIKLVSDWNYVVTGDDGTEAERAPGNALLITEAGLAERVRAELAPCTPFIVLVRDPDRQLPAGAHALPAPVRPAKLRALINQLQKTLSKSTP